MAVRTESAAQGFIIYDKDWKEFLEDYTPDEVVEMMGACIAYHQEGIITEFPDRGMKRFYRDMIRSIDYSNISYYDTCMKNAYNRYIGTCRGKGIEALGKEEWFETLYLPIHPLPVNARDGRQPALPDVTNINRIEERIQDEGERETETEVQDREMNNKNETEEETEPEERDRGVQGRRREEPALINQGPDYQPNSKEANAVFQQYLKAYRGNYKQLAMELRLRLENDYGCDIQELMRREGYDSG